MAVSIFQPVRTDRIVEGKRRFYPDEAEGMEVGDVWVDVKLTNAADISMVEQGYKQPEQVRSINVSALVDTGAVQSAIPDAIANKLGLSRRFMAPVTFADGRTENIPVSEGVIFNIFGREVTDDCFVVGNDVLIGQTVLEKTDLFVDCKERRVVGNPDHPGQRIIRMF